MFLSHRALVLTLTAATVAVSPVYGEAQDIATLQHLRHLQKDTGSGIKKFGISGDFQTLSEWVQSASFRESGSRCGTPDPTAEELAQSEQAISEWLEENPDPEVISRQLESINVVWHSLPKADGSDGITNAMITSSMNVLNDAFFEVGYIFNLAAITTTANDDFNSATDGSVAETNMKAALRVGDCSTLNIYSNSQPAILGWATYPFSCAGDTTDDGVVIDYQTAPGGTGAPYNLGDTLVHQVGHW